MSRKIICIVIIILFVFIAGCNSTKDNLTAKDTLENWRNQDFSEQEQKSTSKNYQGETPSGSMECPIQIVNYKQKLDGNSIFIQGDVYNYGDSSYHNPQITCVKLYVFFYNKNGNLIAEDYFYLNVGRLDYGEKYPFSINTNLKSGTERYLVKLRCCSK